MVSVPALFDRCVSSDQPLINTVKHGSALLLLLLHLSLSLSAAERGRRGFCRFGSPHWLQLKLWPRSPVDLRLRQSPPATDRFAF